MTNSHAHSTKTHMITTNENSQTGGNANESLRFVQLSDLHLSSIHRPGLSSLLNKRILGYLSWLRKRRYTHQRWVLDIAARAIANLHPDHYTITGDLTHIGIEKEFKEAREWLTQLASPTKVTVIPGNHDLYVNTCWKHSFYHWQDYLRGDDESLFTQSPINQLNAKDALTQLNNLYPIIRIRKNVAFIGINSAFNAPWFFATGQVNSRQLQRLEHILKLDALKNYCKVLLVHHPVTLTHTPYRKRLIDHDSLISLLKRHPADIILHGHGHHSCIDRISCDRGFDIPVIGTASTSSISTKQNHHAEFRLFEISRKPSQWQLSQQSHKLDMATRTFIPGKTEKILIPFAK